MALLQIRCPARAEHSFRQARGSSGLVLTAAALLLALLPSRAFAGADGACMAAEFGGNLNCTANDVSISSIEVLQIVDGCSAPGDTAQLKLRATLQVTSNERYDIG